ncbi:PEP-CTERM sorting domain-containing protein [Candidatus Uabimicrobium amorphum]|uniref:Ice-binding protein C-terminal domain-containing protein n=1 Tax=Uabimicrobium amorphum TaxID=2596890 RepID=A0A5S9F4D2_UABAM|nr:PEP-CTERM sorting domain-containing protein [Candidatus Uabimicrobium amorphum]BBM85656.1 hypothetical protein UABAM_04030 [Candidatus Uabimicrobium amorphum]
MRFVIIFFTILNIAFVYSEVITNTDLVGGSAVVTRLPVGWTDNGNLPVSALFDGISANPGNGRVLFQGPTDLSDADFIGITIDLITPFEINSFQMAHDFGSSASQEVVSMDILLNGSEGLIQSFSVDNLNDGNINDIDDVFVGQSIAGVTNIEFRITGNEASRQIEIREFIVTGNAVPEPSTFILLTLLAAIGFFSRKIRRVTPQ